MGQNGASRCAARRLEQGDEGVSASEVEGFVEDITAFMEGRNNELAGIAEKVLMSVEKER